MATFTYTGPINFSNSLSSNTFGDFGFSTSNITGFAGSTYSSSSNSSPLSLAGFLGTTMSTGGYGITTYMEFTGTYSLAAGDTIFINHDDGASLYLNGTPVIYFPGPTSQKLNQYTLPTASSGSFDLVYVEANGAPAILQVTATPEFHWDSAGAALGLLFGGIVVLRGRRQALGS